MAHLSHKEIVKGEAQMMGLSLSDSDIDSIVEKWLSTPICSLRDLLHDVRCLRDAPRSGAVRLLSQTEKK
jgi:hypothetical protein